VYKNLKTTYILTICVLFVLTSTGCDIIKSIKESFTKKETSAIEKIDGQAKTASNVNKPLPANVLARVGSWDITIEEFNSVLDELQFDKQIEAALQSGQTIDPVQAKKEILSELIKQQLLVEEALKTGIANKKEIVKAVDNFRRGLIVNESVNDIVNNTNVSTSDALDMYEQEKESLIEVQWHVREILVDTQIKALEISTEILKGKDFAEAAKEHSISNTAEDGGDLGFIGLSFFQNDPEKLAPMANALVSLEDGEISSVFQGPEGFYLIKLEEKKERQISFEEVKEEIIQIKKRTIVEDYIKKIEQEIKPQVNESLLK